MPKTTVTYQVWDSLHNYRHRTEVSTVDDGVKLASDWLQDMHKHNMKLPRLLVVQVTKEENRTTQQGWLGETITSRPIKAVRFQDNSIVVEDKTEWLS